MKKKELIGMIFVIGGLLLSVYSGYNIIFVSHYINTENISFLMLGPALMILGVLFKYTEEVNRVAGKLSEQKSVKSKKLSNWRVRDLEYRLKKVESEEKEKREETTEIQPSEFEKFKILADNLLADLNPTDIKKFKESKEFELYQKVMSPEDVEESEKREFVLLVDELLGKLPPEKIKRFIETEDDYAIYQKVVKWAE